MLFMFSGFASLIYEIAWEKMLEIYYGVTTLSIALIVAAYMFGLGLGSLIGGVLARRMKHPARVYGILEGCIGLVGFLSIWWLPFIAKTTAGSSYFVVFILSFLILLIPTVLMGATLPLLSQAFVDNLRKTGKIIGVLYGINTLGASLGAFISGYVLIGAWGISGTIIFSAGINIIILFVVLMMSRHVETDGKAGERHRQQIVYAKESSIPPYFVVLIATLIAGFIGMGYEMLWCRIISVINKTSAYNFPTILFIYLLGLALGSMLFGPLADRTNKPWLLFCILELSAALIAVGSLIAFWLLLHTPYRQTFHALFTLVPQPASPFISASSGYHFELGLGIRSLSNFFSLPVLFILPASIIMGGGLPIIDRIAIQTTKQAGRRVAEVYSMNIIGSVSGSLVTSLVLLPTIGTEATLKLLILFSLIFILLFFFSVKNIKEIFHFQTVLLAIAVIMISALLIRLPNNAWIYKNIYEAGIGTHVITSEGEGTVLAFSLDSKGDPITLFIGGEVHSFFPSNGSYEANALLCAGASTPQNVLVIGLGGGHISYFVSTLPGVQSVDIVEIQDKLDGFLMESFTFIEDLFKNPIVHYFVDDGRRFLYSHSDKLYDMIIIDPLYDFTSGSNNLYSEEMLELYKAHLTDSGVLCAFKVEQNVIPHTIAQVFPFVDDFTNQLVSKKSEIQYDLVYMESAINNFIASNDAQQTQANLYFSDPLIPLSNYLRDRSVIMAEEGETPVLRDLNPYLEYYFLRPLASRQSIESVSQLDLSRRVTHCSSDCQEKLIVFQGLWRIWYWARQLPSQHVLPLTVEELINDACNNSDAVIKEALINANLDFVGAGETLNPNTTIVSYSAPDGTLWEVNLRQAVTGSQ